MSRDQFPEYDSYTPHFNQTNDAKAPIQAKLNNYPDSYLDACPDNFDKNKPSDEFLNAFNQSAFRNAYKDAYQNALENMDKPSNLLELIKIQRIASPHMEVYLERVLTRIGQNELNPSPNEQLTKQQNNQQYNQEKDNRHSPLPTKPKP